MRVLEGLVLVPFFKRLSAAEFFAFHPVFGHALFTYFAPLTTAAVVAPVVAAIWAGGGNMALNLAAAGALAVLAFFPLYFKRANAAFEHRQVSAEQLPGRLVQWGRVHSARTVIAVAAFAASVVGVHTIG